MHLFFIKHIALLFVILAGFQAFYSFRIYRKANSIESKRIGVLFLLLFFLGIISLYLIYNASSRDYNAFLFFLSLIILFIGGIVSFHIIILGKISDTQNKSKEYERLFKIIFEKSRDEIYLIDLKGNFVLANPGACKSLGYSREELLSMNIRDVKTSKFYSLVNRNINAIVKQKESRYETEHITKSGDVIQVEMNSHLIEYEGVKMILSIARDITERSKIDKKVMRAIIKTEEKERKRFAADLHDGLSPILSTVKLYTDLVKKGDYNKLNQEKVLQNIDEIVDQAIITTKEIVNDIRPNILNDFGLVDAVKDFCSYINQTKSLMIHIDAENYHFDQRGLPETVLYQSIKELVNNTLKHANATQANIVLESFDEQLNLFYKDNGKGFIPKDLSKTKSGLGLYNLENKIKTIKGVCVINSKPGEGMSVLINFSAENLM